MLRHSLLLALAAGSLMTAPEVLDAQATIFRATGGDVIFTPTGFSNVPFQVFFDALGIHRQIASDDGTSFTLDTRGTVGNSIFGTLGSLNLGPFAAGSALSFSFFYNGANNTAMSFYSAAVDGYNAQYISGTGTFAAGEASVNFRLTGVNSIENFHCTLAGKPLVVCPADIGPGGNAVTATPEPATLGLLATGLVGVAGLAARKKRDEDAA